MPRPSKKTSPAPDLHKSSALSTFPPIMLPSFSADELLRKNRRVKALLKKPVVLDYLLSLTTQTGLIQHATYGIPDLKNGYAVDDNARGLIAAVDHHARYHDKESLQLAKTYLSFVDYMQDYDGRFFTYLAFNHTHPSQAKSEDAYGRAVWGTGYALYRSKDDDVRSRAAEVLHRALQVPVAELTAPRAWAYSIMGLFYFYKAKGEVEVYQRIDSLASRLIACYKAAQDPTADWYWFEDRVTYSNALLPLALLLAWRVTENNEYKQVAEHTFRFLLNNTQVEGVIQPIGEKGWWVKGSAKTFYDQQPLEAAYTILALIFFYRYTRRREYLDYAVAWFLWYYGENSLGKVVYEEKTGICRDGLTETAVNRNGGAESIVTYLIARLEVEALLSEQQR